MFIIYGWGKKLLKRKYLGKRYCSHCSTFTDHYTYGHVSQFTLFLIPIARWKRKHYILCESCNRGAELTTEDLMEIEGEYLFIPEEAIVQKMVLEAQRMVVEIGCKDTDKETIAFSLDSKYNNGKYRTYIETMVDEVCAVRKYELEYQGQIVQPTRV